MPLRSAKSDSRQPGEPSSPRRPLACALAIALPALLAQRLRGEDHADYRFNDYSEEGHRIRVQTHSAFCEWAASSSVTLAGEFVYDAISGASPTGAPPPAGSQQVPLAPLEDVRTDRKSVV